MLSVQSRTPVNYSLCNQTVTIYHKDGDSYTCKILRNAFLDFKKTENVDKTGSREANTFLLVIPCDSAQVFVGDKVLLGEGQAVSTSGEWAKLIPATTPGLVVVSYVDPKYWNGRMVHVEAGG